MFAGVRPVAVPQLEPELPVLDPLADIFLGLPAPPPLVAETTHHVHDIDDGALPRLHQVSSAFDPSPPDTDPFSSLSCFALPRSLVGHPSTSPPLLPLNWRPNLLT